MLARALCAQSFSTLLASFWRRVTTASNVFQLSEGDDSASSGRILALNPEREGMAGKSEEPVTALSELGNGADLLHGPGLSYGNEGCFGPVGLVSESCPLGTTLQDSEREARKVPEEKVASMVVIKYEERVYNGKVRGIKYMHKDTYREWEDLDASRENVRQELGGKQHGEREHVHCPSVRRDIMARRRGTAHVLHALSLAEILSPKRCVWVHHTIP